MITKEKIIETVKNLPDNFSLDDFFDSMILLEKIEKGNQQSINGEVFTTQEAKEKLNKWLK